MPSFVVVRVSTEGYYIPVQGQSIPGEKFLPISSEEPMTNIRGPSILTGMDLPTKINRLLDERSWSQRDLARRMRRSAQSLNNWMNGVEPKRKDLLIIANARNPYRAMDCRHYHASVWRYTGRPKEDSHAIAIR